MFINHRRGDAWSLITLYQRPLPVPAVSIGVWQDIFTIISVIAVVTNGGITVLTMNVLNSYRSSGGGFWFFTCFQWFGFLIQVLAMVYIDDITPDTVVQIKRSEYINSQLFKASDEGSNSGGESKNNFKSFNNTSDVLLYKSKGLKCLFFVYFLDKSYLFFILIFFISVKIRPKIGILAPRLWMKILPFCIK